MIESIFNSIGNQIEEIVEVHFDEDDDKSDERKEWEQKAKLYLKRFQKVLNLAVYVLLVTIIMRFVMILLLNPYQAVYEYGKLEAGLQKKDSITLAFERKQDTILNLQIQLAELKKEFSEYKEKKDKPSAALNIIGAKALDPHASRYAKLSDYVSGTISYYSLIRPMSIPDSISYTHAYNSGFHGTNFFYSDFSDAIYPIVVHQGMNSTLDFSIWKQVWEHGFNWLQFIGISIVFLIVLWLVKMALKLYHFIVALISPFSIMHTIGMVTTIVWICYASTHLFQLPMLFEILKNIPKP